MEKRIGNVILDYTYYKGKDLYSDGDVENELLDIVKEGNIEEKLKSSSRWPILYHLSDIRHNLLEWYPFEQDADILEIGSGCGAITSLLCRQVETVTCIELSEKRSLINAYRNKDFNNIRILLGNFEDIKIDKKFDYVTLIGVWEYSELYLSVENPYLGMLQMIKKVLKPDGKIIIAIENKMGLKYFNGACEDHVSKLYSGLNDYTSGEKVRTFSKPEIEELLQMAGIEEYAFYYPSPDYKIPEEIYSESIQPQVGQIRNHRKNYDKSVMCNFLDATSEDQICHDRMFSYFSNSFLFVCGENVEKIQFARYNRQRKKEFRTGTYIQEHNGKKKVVKKALNIEAQEHIAHMKQNEKIWKNILPNISCVEGSFINGDYEVPYIEGISLEAYFYKYRNNGELFVDLVKKIIGDYFVPGSKTISFYKTDEFVAIFGEDCPDDAKCLPVSNIDITLSNVKLLDSGEVVNFDYEWVFDFPIPYEYIIWRMLSQLYAKYMVYLKRTFSKKEFLVSVGLDSAKFGVYENMEASFAEYVFGKRTEELYLKNYRKGICMSDIRMV